MLIWNFEIDYLRYTRNHLPTLIAGRILHFFFGKSIQTICKYKISIRKKKIWWWILYFSSGKKKRYISVFFLRRINSRDHYNEWVLLMNGTCIPRIRYSLDSRTSLYRSNWISQRWRNDLKWPCCHNTLVLCI